MARQKLPDNLREEIMLELYRRASELDWELLPNPEKTSHYETWFAEPRIGGMLGQFYGEKSVRVWIKDTAMKEYARAQEGIGANLRYVPRRYRGPEQVVAAALGPEWELDRNSIDIKPMRCAAGLGGETRLVVWGSKLTLSDLFWEGVTQAVDTPTEPVIVIATRDGQDVQANERLRHEALGERCGLRVVHLHRDMIDNPDYIG